MRLVVLQNRYMIQARPMLIKHKHVRKESITTSCALWHLPPWNAAWLSTSFAQQRDMVPHRAIQP